MMCLLAGKPRAHTPFHLLGCQRATTNPSMFSFAARRQPKNCSPAISTIHSWPIDQNVEGVTFRTYAENVRRVHCRLPRSASTLLNFLAFACGSWLLVAPA